MAVKKTTTKKKPAVKKPVAKKTTSAKKSPAKKTTTKKTAAKSTAQKPVKLKKAVNKTQETNASVEDFLNSLGDVQKRKDGFTLLQMMQTITKEKPKLWGSAIIGFGNLTITSKSGRVVDWFKMGFAPRKANFSLYLGIGHDAYAAELKKLGKYKTDGGCLYINQLADVDVKVLEGIMKKAGFKERM